MNWLHQFWQQKFKCHLPHSPVIDTRFDNVCTGDEHISAIDVYQSDYIHQTIGFVNGIYKQDFKCNKIINKKKLIKTFINF